MNMESKISGITYRIATPEDAPALLKVYAPYVMNTAITFEYTVPTVEEFQGRIRNTLTKFPYIVAIYQNEIVGYAYASPFHARAAYQWCAELSIYISRECHGMGLGREMYEIMEELLKKQNILNLYACIAHAPVCDEHLTNASEAFHSKLGFKHIGHFTQCGYKFDTWYDMVWMEKHIGEHHANMPEFIPFEK